MPSFLLYFMKNIFSHFCRKNKMQKSPCENHFQWTWFILITFKSLRIFIIICMIEYLNDKNLHDFAMILDTCHIKNIKRVVCFLYTYLHRSHIIFFQISFRCKFNSIFSFSPDSHKQFFFYHAAFSFQIKWNRKTRYTL